jgi:predicted metal-dependent HD superfamily phosphohydrolase
MNLRERFKALWLRLGARGNPDKVFNDLIRCYQESHRKYHNVAHLEFGLTQFDLIADLAVHPDWVEFAFFFHDSVYVIGATDNEKRSTRLAIEVLKKAKASGAVQLYVGAMIMTTKPGELANSPDQQVISDIDLAILGQKRRVFVEYERQVREEYAEVPEEIFWSKRKEILEGFRRRPSIYSTNRFQQRYEKKAQKNLAWTIGVH